MPEASEEAAARLSAGLGLHPLAARVLAGRGLSTAEAASEFLKGSLADLPDPFTMKGMAKAVERVCRAIGSGEKLTLYGDYDVDGVCSTSLLRLFLEGQGAKVATYIPHRIEEGYGLNLQAIERIAADGTRLLVTLDCGIASAAEIARANALGLEVVVADHHTVPEALPPALVVLNPHQPGCGYPTKHLCAAGVAFNLCMGLRRRLREQGAFSQRPEPNLRELLDLVALATVADVVPLTGANRIFVRHGLAEISRARRPGIRALKEVAGLGGEEPVTAGDLGYKLGPRINAAGRLADAAEGLRLLCAPNLDEARALARELDSANRERQLIEQQILAGAVEQAQARPQARGLVLHSETWHPGVIGIVASRIVERFHRPTVMVAVKDGMGRGSARSIEAFHLYDALAACSEHLARYGGHKHAAGLSVEASRLGAFIEAFERIARERLTDGDLVPRLRLDALVRPEELDERGAEAVAALGPFGAGNPNPVFAARAASVQPRILPSKRDGEKGHLKLKLDAAPKLDAIGFSMADRAALAEGPVDLAFQLGIDEWNGRRRVQLKLKDLRAAK